MWKWIVGAALLIVVVVIGTCWYGVRQLLSGGNQTSVTIAATPEHVFAMIADRDSMPVWMEKSSRPGSGHGMLAVGDTARVDSTARMGRSGVPQRMAWTVSLIDPEKLLVTEVHDTAGRLAFVRRDSIAGVGDSTMLITVFTMPAMDSIRRAQADTGGSRQTVERLIGSALRLRAEGENTLLKNYLEGKPAANQ